MNYIVVIYASWLSVAALMFVAGVPADVMGAMLGAPVGWTIGLLIIAGYYRFVWHGR